MKLSVSCFFRADLERNIFMDVPLSAFSRQFGAKKKIEFFNGEVLFLLTSPLMDDPFFL